MMSQNGVIQGLNVTGSQFVDLLNWRGKNVCPIKKMRKLAAFNTPSLAMAMTKAALPPEATVIQQSQCSSWHSPTEYIFVVLIPMLGLILAFCLLILVCPFRRHSECSRSGGDNQSGERDVESNEKDRKGGSDKAVKVYEDKILVIMAGDENPTFLATPVSTKACAFGDGKEMAVNEGEKVENGENA